MDFFGELFPELPASAEVGPGEMVMSVGGTDYAIPNPDGLDSATFTSDQGMAIVSDLDGDGRVDYVSTVSHDGHWSAWRPGGGAQPPSEGETGLSDGESGQIESSATPDGVGEAWDSGVWECVDRGQWG